MMAKGVGKSRQKPIMCAKLSAMNGIAFFLLAVAMAFASGCGKAKEPVQATGSRTNHIFQVKGILKEIKPDGKTAIIQHEEIPDYMAAMTMPLDVKNTNEFKGLQPGDAISFRMIITEDDGWIDQLKKIEASEVKLPTPAITSRFAPEVEPLSVGDPIPNYTFTNALGKAVPLESLKGTAYAMTFIFTRCPFPDFCPRMNKNFEEAYKNLTKDSSTPSNWKLLTLSFDPEFDTPQVLRVYAQQYKADPNKWSFLTGSIKDIDAITEQFGLVFPRSAQGFDHNLRTAVVDARGRVHHIFIGNSWTADELVEQLSAAARVTSAATAQAQ